MAAGNDYTVITRTVSLHMPYEYRCRFCGLPQRVDEGFPVEILYPVYDREPAATNSEQALWLGKETPPEIQNEIRERTRVLENFGHTLSAGYYAELLRTGKRAKDDRRMYALPKKYFDPRCPLCGKEQPWSVDPAGKGTLLMGIMFGIAAFAAVLLLGMAVLYRAGISEHFGEMAGRRGLPVIGAACAASALTAISAIRIRHRKILDKLLGLNLRQNDLPVYLRDQFRLSDPRETDPRHKNK